jgi:hypothetical protein
LGKKFRSSGDRLRLRGQLVKLPKKEHYLLQNDLNLRGLSVSNEVILKKNQTIELTSQSIKTNNVPKEIFKACGHDLNNKHLEAIIVTTVRLK